MYYVEEDLCERMDWAKDNLYQSQSREAIEYWLDYIRRVNEEMGRTYIKGGE